MLAPPFFSGTFQSQLNRALNVQTKTRFKTLNIEGSKRFKITSTNIRIKIPKTSEVSMPEEVRQAARKRTTIAMTASPKRNLKAEPIISVRYQGGGHDRRKSEKAKAGSNRFYGSCLMRVSFVFGFGR